MPINHETYPRRKGDTRGIRKTPEDSQSKGTGRDHQVGPAGPTLAPPGPLWLGFGLPFCKLPPPPLRSHLDCLLSRFDPTARVHPTRLQIEGKTPLEEARSRDEELEH